MKIVISAESALDLPKDLLQKYNIKTTPFGVLLGDELLKDGEFDVEAIFEYVSKNKILPKTSAVNEYQFTEHFKNLKKEYDVIIHLSMSSTMSCAYQNAISASKKFENIFVVDTKNLSTGIALLAINASNMASEGKSVQEILEWINGSLPKVQTSLIVDKLDYLKKGGRCSSLVCFGANLLKIHPQIILKNGKLTPAKKYRGNYETCIENYCKDTIKEFNNYDNNIAFLTYTTLSQGAKSVARSVLKSAGFKNIIEVKTGATIASHAGPNAMGIIYLTI